MIAAVVKAFGDWTLKSLDNVFLSLQAVLECIMNNEGSNAFKLPHLGKAALRRQGKLPEMLTCSVESIEAALEALFNFENSLFDQ
jgi:hypothetical protein